MVALPSRFFDALLQATRRFKIVSHYKWRKGFAKVRDAPSRPLGSEAFF